MEEFKPLINKLRKAFGIGFTLKKCLIWPHFVNKEISSFDLIIPMFSDGIKSFNTTRTKDIIFKNYDDLKYNNILDKLTRDLIKTTHIVKRKYEEIENTENYGELISVVKYKDEIMDVYEGKYIGITPRDEFEPFLKRTYLLFEYEYNFKGQLLKFICIHWQLNAKDIIDEVRLMMMVTKDGDEFREIYNNLQKQIKELNDEFPFKELQKYNKLDRYDHDQWDFLARFNQRIINFGYPRVAIYKLMKHLNHHKKFKEIVKDLVTTDGIYDLVFNDLAIDIEFDD